MTIPKASSMKLIILPRAKVSIDYQSKETGENNRIPAHWLQERRCGNGVASTGSLKKFDRRVWSIVRHYASELK